MRLEKLILANFRNIQSASFYPGEELTVITGANGQGKTNLLEAVWLLTGAKSFRGAKDPQLIREGQQFAVCTGHVGQRGEVLPGERAERLVGAVLVDVDADQIHAVVARIVVRVSGVAAVGESRGDGPEQIGETSFVLQVFEGQAPQRLVLLRGAVGGAPPEPSAGHFVPGAPDDGNGLSVVVAQRGEEVAHTRQPFAGQGMEVAPFEHPGRRTCGILHVPGVASRGRVGGVPAHRDDSAAAVVFGNPLADQPEGKGTRSSERLSPSSMPPISTPRMAG